MHTESTVERLHKEVLYHRQKWWDYEQQYILPTFEWAAELGIDLRQLVTDNPGKNCVQLLVETLRDRLKDCK